MKRLLAAAILALAACVSPTGGAPVSVYAELQLGGGAIAYDFNTAVAIVQGSGIAFAREVTTKSPLYTPFIFGEAGVYVRVRDMGDGSDFEGSFDFGEPIPVELRPFVLGVMTPSELGAWGVFFEGDPVPSAPSP